MKRIGLLFFLLPVLAQAAAPQPPAIAGRSWVVGDLSSGQVLRAEKPDERVEPASLTKLMTAYVVFQALRDKKLTLDQQVNVSERAWRVPGSRMFIQPRKPVSVDELIRGMVVQSGNDACLALAEAAAGAEEVFVQLMNREAARIGMKNTKFTNATGLPDPQHYSTAQDLYLLAGTLIRDFPREYAQYYSQREFRYNNISQPNRNRLLWLDPSVDGVKTGHTEAAGYCLIASSNRSGRRLLSVLLGSTSEAARAQESQKLLNWGFQFFDSVKLHPANQPVKAIEVWKGSGGEVKAGRSDRHRAQGRGRQAEGGVAHAAAAPRARRPGPARRYAARDARRQAAWRVSGRGARGGRRGRYVRTCVGYTAPMGQVAERAWFF
jgi:D-alanyl-D-alanine carboxypeptidase (penicillin-binding protein 5/6)